MIATQNAPVKTRSVDELIETFNKIRTLYTVQEPLETLKLFIEEESLAPLIIEGYSKIRTVFPTERLALEIRPDPEIVGWRPLWLIIYTNLEVDEALEKLNIIDDHWWLEAMIQVSNKLHINIDWEGDAI